MPLGILLAATWVEILSPREIAAEIVRGLDFLETDWRDVPERQRSIRAVYTHSWNLLTEREHGVFQGLSVFRGGFTREAAQAVTGATLRELIALATKSLLHPVPVGRYEVHELLRQYAAEKLGQSPAAAEKAYDRYAAYYASALQKWNTEIHGPRPQVVLAEMDAEIDNVRAAWSWMAERGQAARLGQAADGLGYYIDWRKGNYAFKTLYGARSGHCLRPKQGYRPARLKDCAHCPGCWPGRRGVWVTSNPSAIC
jgi:predicted ATPase